MLASKENAEIARQRVNRIRIAIDAAISNKATRQSLLKSVSIVEQFIDAAKRKLPREAAFEAERLRNKKPG